MSSGYIYLYGMTLMTNSHRLAADFPSPDTYCEIAESHRLPGGETGTCAVILGNWGLNVLLDGNHLGRSTYPAIESYFASSGVSLELMTCDPEFAGLEDLVFVDRQTRTAFGRFGEFFAPGSARRWNPASEAAVRRATVAGLDPFFLQESIDVARLCHTHNVRYATIDCRADSEVHRLSEVTVLSAEFLLDNYADRDLESLFDEYRNDQAGLVIFTFGAKALWYGRPGQVMQRFNPYVVDVESTLGAGDAFKAGVIYALSQGMDDATLVRFASATAAAACMRYPIARFPPGLADVFAVANESFDIR